MRRAAFVIALGMMGCATLQGPAAPAASPAHAASPTPGKNEVVVFGRAPPKMGGIKPQDEGTEFVVQYRRTYRCTKVKPSAENPSGLEYCRDIHNAESRNPDPGRMERAQTQGGAR